MMMDTELSEDGNSDQIDQVDRISSLPDSILSHILSFVPTKEAVATSILSSGWKSHWTRVPIIDVEVPRNHKDMGEKVYFNACGERVRFQNFLNNILLLNREQCLRYCRLTIPPDTHSVYANAWIEAIATREVKEMHLKILERLEVPFCVFTCRKLEILTLSSFGLFKVPTSVHLPNLRIINLISFHVNDGPCLRLLTSGCPCLRELTIDRCTFLVHGTNYYFCSSSLKKLQIINNYGLFSPIAVIDAPSLEYLVISFSGTFGYEISALPCLREADISLCESWPIDQPTFTTNALKFLKSVASLTTLRLRRLKFQDVEDSINHQFPMFNNLTLLELEMCGRCCCFVPVILEHAPNLVNLIVKSSRYADIKDCERSHLIQAPSCLVHSIKVIEIQKFDGSKDVMEMVSYLLMNAKVLNEMKIYFASMSPELLNEEMKGILLSLPRGSSTCSVLLYSRSGSIL